MNKWLEILVGLILLIGIILIAFWSHGSGRWDLWSSAWIIFKGAVFWIIFAIGTILILLGISDLKN